MPRGADIQKWRAEGFFETIRKNPNITNEELGRKFDMAENTCLKMRRFRSVTEWETAKKEKSRRQNELRQEKKEQAAMALRAPEVTDAEEQLTGQMEMEMPVLKMQAPKKPEGAIHALITDELNAWPAAKEKPEMSDTVKLMRFMAGQVDKLYMKLETINDTLNQMLRAWQG